MCVEVCYRLQSTKLSISNKCVLNCAGEPKVRHLRGQFKCCYNGYFFGVCSWKQSKILKLKSWNFDITSVCIIKLAVGTSLSKSEKQQNV